MDSRDALQVLLHCRSESGIARVFRSIMKSYIFLAGYGVTGMRFTGHKMVHTLECICIDDTVYKDVQCRTTSDPDLDNT